MRWQTFLSVLCGFLGGCGGQYILTVPDQLAAEGGDAVAVVRLQRSEFYLWAPPSPEAAPQVEE